MAHYTGFIAGLYSDVLFKYLSAVSMPDLDVGYGQVYGHAYGAGVSHIKYASTRVHTLHGGYTQAKISQNVLSGKSLPYISFSIFGSELSPIADFAGVQFPTVYAHPISYLTDPNVTPQEWWHVENGQAETLGFITGNQVAMLLSPISSHNQYIGYGEVQL